MNKACCLDTALYSLLNEKNAQNVWSYDLVHKEPFGYQAANHGYTFNFLFKTSMTTFFNIRVKNISNINLFKTFVLMFFYLLTLY